MTISRREFLRRSAVIGGAAGLGVPVLASAAGTIPRSELLPRIYRPEGGTPRALRILFMGGTGFTGPYQVQYALDRGHQVTLFNRGSNTTIFPGVPRIQGDRNKPDAYSGIGKGEWDVVIDIPTSDPKWVRAAGEALKDRTPHYVFVSTISVFNDNSEPNDENGKLSPPSDIDAPYNAAAYGANKRASELEAERQFRNVTIVRPGLIVGPGDNSDRFSYWPVRIERGGDVMAPGTPDDPTQYIDARDLAEWIVRLAEDKVYGTFNATGPRTPTNMGELLYGIRSVTEKETRFLWVDAAFLSQHRVRAWSDMPVWVNPVGANKAFMRVNTTKAFAHGLTTRPLADTARDTLVWYHKQPQDRQEQLKAGISAEREAEVLAAWKSAKGIR